MMISTALEVASGDLTAIADEVGVSYPTLWAWKAGKRTPGVRNLRRLAKALRRRGEQLTDLAERLDRAALED